MRLKMWTLDLAREQSPTLDHLRLYAQMTSNAGYDALGLYLEHRFAYPCAPWAHGQGCVTVEMVGTIVDEFPGIQIVPFVNLLGHMEGTLYTEEGKAFAEERFKGMQACPCNSEFVSFANRLLDDTLAAFSSDIVHIGGDETWQLGICEKCAKIDKAELYGRHFGPLAQKVVDAGRTPAVWGDMFVDHPSALAYLPKETIVFDWHYFDGIKETAPKFTSQGFRVVGCPTLHVYNAPWFHVERSEQNVREVAGDVRDLDLHGVCLTTWESGLLGAYDTLFPAIAASSLLMDDPSARGFLEAYETSTEWATLMGVELEKCGGVFAFSGHRNKLKSRTLLYSNPFLAWMHHADELSGEAGDRALSIIERASLVANGEAEKGVCIAVRSMIEFVRITEEARQLYAKNEPEAAIGRLTATRTIIDMMMRVARRSHERIGGSLADTERCKSALNHVDRVIVRLRNYGRRQLGYLPAWEIITHPMFVPHDQACWWLVNSWGRE